MVLGNGKIEESMRTIKFRGKRVNNGEWGYGDYHRRAGGVHCIIAMEPDEQGKVCYVVNQVDPKTVGQFTGLLDKNGDEIYEGDVLQRIPNEQYSDATGIPLDMLREDIGEGGDMVFVRYDESQARVMYYSLIDRFNSPWLNTKYFTVIGNIHDNPELLKK